MRIRATVTKDGYVSGQEYDIDATKATAMIVAGAAELVTVAPNSDRETAIPRRKYETR
jgi:hypothetical protein